MNQEERRLALMRQRGELPQEPEKKEKESGKSGSGKQEKKTSFKKPPARTAAKKNGKKLTPRQLQIIRRRLLGLLAAALILVILLALAIRGCMGAGKETAGSSEALSENQTAAASDSAQGQITETSDLTAGTAFGTGEIAPSETEEIQTAASSQAEVLPTSASGTVETGHPDWPVNIAGMITPSWIDQEFIRINEYSRPQIPLTAVDYIAIHWVGNPNTTAMNNRNYFDHLGDPEDPYYGATSASAHLVVGLEGEIVQVIPLDEEAYAVESVFNPYTISIEVCHEDWEGKFSDVTIASLVKLTAWLMQQFDVPIDHVIRHYDCTTKDCPKYYVDHPEAWDELRNEILEYYTENPSIQ